jgi:hypothetical protein
MVKLYLHSPILHGMLPTVHRQIFRYSYQLKTALPTAKIYLTSILKLSSISSVFQAARPSVLFTKILYTFLITTIHIPSPYSLVDFTVPTKKERKKDRRERGRQELER